MSMAQLSAASISAVSVENYSFLDTEDITGRKLSVQTELLPRLE